MPTFATLTEDIRHYGNMWSLPPLQKLPLSVVNIVCVF